MNRKLVSGAMGLVATVLLVGVAGVENLASRDPSLPVLQSAYGLPVRSGNPAAVQPIESVRPVSIRAAGIGLDASVISVGVDAEKRFDVPAADLVGWYEFGPTPGSAGASVLAAHVDYAGQQGAFFYLHKLQVGERFEVELEDGSVMQYEVTGNTTYNKFALPSTEIFRKDGKPVLQLVTCGGTFDATQRSYDANVVVSAVLV